MYLHSDHSSFDNSHSTICNPHCTRMHPFLVGSLHRILPCVIHNSLQLRLKFLYIFRAQNNQADLKKSHKVQLFWEGHTIFLTIWIKGSLPSSRNIRIQKIRKWWSQKAPFTFIPTSFRPSTVLLLSCKKGPLFIIIVRQRLSHFRIKFIWFYSHDISFLIRRCLYATLQKIGHEFRCFALNKFISN